MNLKKLPSYLFAYENTTAHALITYQISKKIYDEKIVEEIAVGQSLGAWDESFVSKEILKSKVAKVISIEEREDFFYATLGFPMILWHGKLSWLLTLAFGKMSFYPEISLYDITLEPGCFDKENLIGPKFDFNQLSILVQKNGLKPLLMGILKPNVAMTPNQIAYLYEEAAKAEIDFLKDDEIRFDNCHKDLFERIELIRNIREKNNYKTIYAINLPIEGPQYLDLAKELEKRGAQAFIVNTWIYGIDILQNLRRISSVPILSHPALVGAFTIGQDQKVHPRVTLAQMIRYAGADMSLFPSPYGKIGTPKKISLDIAMNCQKSLPIKEITPVPSAGIQPEHCQQALKDFGNKFVLNAGTSIFANKKNIETNIKNFQKELYQ